MTKSKQKFLSFQEGSVLIEMLVVIGVIGVIAGTIGGVFYANQRGSVSGRQQTIEASLVQEALEAIKSVVAANDSTSQGWNRIYCPPSSAEPTEGGTCPGGSKGAPDSNPYKIKVVGNVWKFYQGSESIVIGGETYTRAIHIENVTRDSNDQIGAGDDDPLTQKITIKITPPTGTPVATVVSYITRSAKKQSSPAQAPAVQTDWSGGEVSDTPTCATVITVFGNQYCADDNNADVTGTPGSIKILTQ